MKRMGSGRQGSRGSVMVRVDWCRSYKHHDAFSACRTMLKATPWFKRGLYQDNDFDRPSYCTYMRTKLLHILTSKAIPGTYAREG